MRLSGLWDAKVRTLDGEILGRVHEVHAEGGRIVALTCGAGSLVERLTARSHGRRIPWECVRRIARKEVVVTSDPPRRMSKPKSGPRTQRRTPPATGRRSAR
ncbi:MAG: PRC-barrel domain-containing protein [Sphingomonas sp.]